MSVARHPAVATKRRLKEMLATFLKKQAAPGKAGAKTPKASSDEKSSAAGGDDTTPATPVVLPEIKLPRDPLSDRITMDALDAISPSEQVELDVAVTLGDAKRRLLEIFEDDSFELDKAEQYLAEATFREPVGVADVVSTLKSHGVAVFPAIYDAERLKRVQSQYDAMLAGDQEHAYSADARADTAAHSHAVTFIRESLPLADYDEIHALFGSKIIEEISRRVFSGQVFEFNPSLYAQWTKQTDVPASGVLHWDKQLTLKSWLYVTEGTSGYGAMRVGIGSNRWLRLLREEIMHEGVGYNAIDNSVDEASLPVVSTGGPAGTFFLFVTDTAHGASPVAAGKTRNIIRSQSRPIRIKEWAAWSAKR